MTLNIWTSGADTAAVTDEANTRATADTALDARLDVVEAALPRKATLSLNAIDTGKAIDAFTGAPLTISTSVALDNKADLVGGKVASAQVIGEKLHLQQFAIDNNMAFSAAESFDPAFDSQPVIRAALDFMASLPAQSGIRKTLQLPPGSMVCSRGVGVVPKDCSITGASRGNPAATTILFRSNSSATSFDPAVFGGETGFTIQQNAPFYTYSLDSLAIRGQNALSVTSVDPPEQYGTGVRGWQGASIRDCYISGFCYGYDNRGDHHRMHNVKSQGNWSGYHFGAFPPTIGDNILSDCDLSGNSRCSISVHPTAYCNARFTGGHIGYSIDGIRKLAQSRMRTDYTTGTISTAPGSKTVTGVGTAWLANVKQGDYFWTTGIDSNRSIMVDEVLSNTSLRLAQPYNGTNTPSGAAYQIGDGPPQSQVSPSGKGYNPWIILGLHVMAANFEAITGTMILAEEGGKGNISEMSMYDELQGNAAAQLGGRACIDCDLIERMHVHGQQQFFAINGSEPWTDAALLVREIKRSHLGELTSAQAALTSKGIPFVKAPPGQSLRLTGVTCTVDNQPGRIARVSNGFVQRGELVKLVPSTPNFGLAVQVHDTPRNPPFGTAVSFANGPNEGVIVARPPTLVRTNVAPSVTLDVAAAAGNTTLTVRGHRFGSAGVAIGTLVDSAGTVRASNAVVASATTLTVDAMAGSLNRGFQLFQARTTGASVAASTYVQPRTGSQLLMSDVTATSVLQTGGFMTAGTYAYMVAAYDTTGETLASNEVSGTVTTTAGRVQLNWPSVAGAAGYRVYKRAGALGQVQVFDAGLVTQFTDTGQLAFVNGTYPTVNTTAARLATSDYGQVIAGVADGRTTLTGLSQAGADTGRDVEITLL